ncbi:MAG: hypothetical protein J6C98_08825 [Oscillospiraceae bacterium]|nr:hypothetical protein [Oscillospiraceae bacterium]
MKKLIAILLCLLLSATLAIPTMAAGTTVMTITTDTTTAKPGDEIEFKISMSGSDKCTSFGLLLEYDAKVFEVVEGECTLKDALFSTFDKDKGLACMLKDAASIDGEVGTFILRVKSGASAGKVEVSGTSSVKNGSDTVKSEVEEVKLTISGGTGTQSSGSSGSGSTETQSSSSSGTQEKPAIGEAEAVIATEAAPAETAVVEETPEAPEAAPEEVPDAEAEKEEAPATQLIMPAPETGAKESNKDMIVLAVAGAVVLLAAVVLIVVLKKSRR